MPLYNNINNFSVRLQFCYSKPSFHYYFVIISEFSFDLSYNFTILKNNPALVKFI